MLEIIETEIENVFEMKGKMTSENFHISVNGIEDTEMENENGDAMYWNNEGENWFEQALLGYAECYNKLTDKIVKEVKDKHYAKAVNMLNINNLVTYYNTSNNETIILKDYCFYTEGYLDKYPFDMAYIAKNEASKLCQSL